MHENQDFDNMYTEYKSPNFCTVVKTLQFSVCMTVQYNESKPKKVAYA